MLNRIGIRAFSFLAILTVSWSPAQSRAGEGDPAVPIGGIAKGTVTGFVPPNGLVIQYGGTATHLGLFTREERLFLFPDGSVTGTIVFTAANGDELWADVSGGFISPTNAEGTYTFTGGTGRFVNATGSATFEAYTPDGIHVAVAFEGTIRY